MRTYLVWEIGGDCFEIKANNLLEAQKLAIEECSLNFPEWLNEPEFKVWSFSKQKMITIYSKKELIQEIEDITEETTKYFYLSLDDL